MQNIRLKNTLLIMYLFLPILNLSNLFSQEDYLFENISVAEGLSSSSFSPFQNIYQDKFGFLWFGTNDGLNRYDGYEFKIYKNIPGDSTSLPSSTIQLITEDAEDNLWIGTVGNMSMLDRKSNTFRTFSIDQGSITLSQGINILRSLLDSKNNFIIGTQGKSAQKWNKNLKRWEIIPFMVEVNGVDTLVKRDVNGIFALLELRNGNILASEFSNGIFYYNESSKMFEPFKFAGNDSPTGIVEIFEDRSGKIWFGGKDVFIEYNPKTFDFEFRNDWQRLKGGGGDSYYFNINEREDGTFLMCSFPHGLLKFDPSTKQFEHLKISSDLEQRGIGKFAANKIIDNFGVYWIGLVDNGILKFDPNRKPFKYYAFNDEKINQGQRSITTDLKPITNNSNEILVSTVGKGFLKFNVEKKSFSELKINLPSIYSDSANVSSFVIDDENKLWFPSSPKNISSFDLATGKTESFKITGINTIRGGGELISSIEYIPKNKLVISSNFGGYIFNTVTKTIENIPSVTNRTYSKDLMNDIKSILSSGEKIASFTKVGEAANLSEKFSLSTETEILIICLGEGQYPQGVFDSGNIRDENNKTIWAMDSIKNTFHGGGGHKNRLQIEVITLQPGNYSINYISDVGHSYGAFNVIAPNNPEWYGIQTIKLSKSVADEFRKKLNTEKRKNNVPDLFQVSYTSNSRKYPSAIWIGADENGIVKYDLTTKQFEQYFLNDMGSSLFTTGIIFEDSKGRLWFTINPSGFYRFDPEKKEFISNSDIPDLPIAGINSIVEDYNGSLWISSNGGITKLTENSDGNFSSSNYDSKDGVPGGFGSGALIDREGEIFFGSFNGLTAFFPSTENTSPPIPVISNITVSDVSIFDINSKVRIEKSIYETETLNLSFAQNDVSFDFASIHYSRPSKNRVSYMLEGFNDHWIFTDKNFASFTNLEPGDYKLRVKAYSGFGAVSLNERILNITVDPPWYRTTAAYISYFLLFVGIIFGIDRIQRKRLLTKEREKQKIQEAELRAYAAEAQSKVIQAENDRKTKELEEARQLQLSMLPKNIPQLTNFDIAVYMKTATEVGGDYYDFHISLDGTLTVVIGDATGHGMRAGTMVTAAKSLFSTHAANPDILFTFSEISRCIKHMDMHLLTMCMSILKIHQNKMIMSSAGMPPTLLYRSNTNQLEEITIKGMPLGAVNKFPYAMRETELFSGDTILLMSDGLPELFNNKKQMFGYDKVQTEFHKIAEKSPEEIIDRLKENAADWADNAEPDDDITFVVIKVK